MNQINVDERDREREREHERKRERESEWIKSLVFLSYLTKEIKKILFQMLIYKKDVGKVS